ncbi:hypothetical protein [Aliarcobacter butzleri]|uniref:hypothetical protein n=1 Tax=Aliarcobacter butzleri TaxID=28197 RepID=UPI00125FA31A|nr:hypothetical protein [Aliarcobacter butzleri]MCT7596677.1 hypothetical protein [Aliarcobacter butzleri]MDK2083500.1 hypothetical protein [Aliarcobacter butzleri]
MKNIFFIIFLMSFSFANEKQVEIEDFLFNWDRAFNSKNIELFKTIYSNSVSYYRNKNEKIEDVIKDKTRLFKKYPDFNQKSKLISFEKSNDNLVKIIYTKHTYFNNERRDFNSYLIVDLDKNLVIEENDLPKDFKIPSNQNKTIEHTPNSNETINKPLEVEILDLSPKGYLADIFNSKSKYTDEQRENVKEQLIGKNVRWQLDIYQVFKISENRYKISTNNGESYVKTTINIKALSNNEAEYIERLKAGDTIGVQGKISGFFLERIILEQAILY